jgi:hypothetical protein
MKNFKIQQGDNFNFLPNGWTIWKVQEVFTGASNLCRQKESIRFYLLVDDIRKEFRPHIKACRDSTALILNDTLGIMNKWKQYFQDLLGRSEMEVIHMRKETEQETNEVE